MDVKIKCSLEEHKEIDAISFCPECRIYMCDKCENTHSSLLKNHHHPYNLSDEEIFTGFCKEKNHPNKLEYFCRNHNQLCCAACLCKLKEKGDGQHKDCDVCNIESIKDEKKNKLKENIQCLEKLETVFTKYLNELENYFFEIKKDKEDLKIKVQNTFTKLINALKKRENELMEEIDDLFKKHYNENLIKKGEKLPKQIKSSIEKGKLIDKEWNNNNLYSNVNDCINIENYIKNINNIKENINKYKMSNKVKVHFNAKEDSLHNFFVTSNSIGKIYLNIFKFKECPKNIRKNRVYSLSGENKNIITKTGKGGWMGTLCEYELDKSIEVHKWKIKILHTQEKIIMVGVAPIDFDINTSNYSTCGWYFYCYNSTLYSGPPFNYGGSKTNLSQVNDEIIVVMNMKKKSLKFIINNEDKGDSYTGIPIDKPIYPAILLDNSNDSVQITEI